ncbi:MAG: VOC family protein [Litorimonas sp.]
MAQILGLGGVFIRCVDANKYRRWWLDHMEVDITAWGTMEWPHLDDGPSRTMLSPFDNNTDYFDPSIQPVMINLRTDNVPAMLERAEEGGAWIAGDAQETEYGVFGWFIDPEGYKIELWQEP